MKSILRRLQKLEVECDGAGWFRTIGFAAVEASARQKMPTGDLLVLEPAMSRQAGQRSEKERDVIRRREETYAGTSSAMRAPIELSIYDIRL